MEALIFEKNVFNKELMGILTIVKEFIIKHNLILYGGQAIDYMLRMQGSKLYDDNVMPDYDFYSTTHVDHAYMLVGVLMENGYDINELNVINAFHPQTIRVRYKFHFIADISYLPQNVFDKIKSMALEYKNIMTTNPYLQYIDMHSSLFLPFRSFPLENIYNRWKKDLTRYNLLYTFYKLPEKELDDFKNTDLCSGVINTNLPEYTLLGGMPLYSLLFKRYRYFMKLHNKKINNNVKAATFHIKNNEIQYSTYCNNEGNYILPVFIYHYIDKNIIDQYVEKKEYKFYKPLLDIIPPRIKNDKIEYQIMHGNKICINHIDIAESPTEEQIKISTISTQQLLAYMLSIAIFENQPIGYSLYNSLLIMIKEVEELNINTDNPFQLNVDVINDKNDEPDKFVKTPNDDRALIEKYELTELLPIAYYPKKGIKEKSQFTYNLLYELDGLEISNIYDIFRIKYNL